MADDDRVDVVDENDVVVRVATRREVRQRNLRHRCVYILVFDSMGRLAVHQRTATKDVYPSFWDLAFGGVLDAGESYDAAAERELFEECGLRVPLSKQFQFTYSQSDNRVFGMVYRGIADRPLALQAEEVVRVEWVMPSEIAELSQTRPFCPDSQALWQIYSNRLDRAESPEAR